MLKASRPSDQYLMISAHIDGLEPDFDGVWYPGAFDNASGVAAMLEIARQFKEQKLKPSVNLVFVGFAGEEPLLDGSTYYASDPLFPLENTKVINMDGIGAKADADLLFLVAGGMNRGNPFVQEFEQTARTLGYTARVVPDDYSDHRPLAEKGVPAVTVDDDDQYSWHLPTDDIYNISRERLERDFDVTMAVVLEETGLRGK
jgi:Zn-dependent M28 family amino/carboxypeptidase